MSATTHPPARQAPSESGNDHPEAPEVLNLLLNFEYSLSSIINDELLNFGVTYSQFTALKSIYLSQPISPSRLADEMRVSRASVTQLIKVLGNKHLAQKVIPAHRKRGELAATKVGETKIRDCEVAISEITARLLGDNPEILSDKFRDLFNSILLNIPTQQRSTWKYDRDAVDFWGKRS